MNQLTADQWNALLPKLREVCPRITAEDLADCDNRLDLLVAKVQNRHWVNRENATKTVVGVAKASGLTLA